MVQTASSNHATPAQAAIAFGNDHAADAKDTKREPNAGIVELAPGNNAYTAPIWGETNQKFVDTGDYSEALIAVYGSAIKGLAHIHYDSNRFFSPEDVFKRGNWTYYLRNQKGETRLLNNALYEAEVESTRSGRTAHKVRYHMSVKQGAEGECIDACAGR